MFNSPSLQKLRSAVNEEQLDAAWRAAEYEALLAKMKAYQAGDGPAPTMQEFMLWRTSVEHRLAEHKIKVGFSDSE